MRIIRYWLKLLYSPKLILRTVHEVSLNDSEKGLSNWVTNVKLLLFQFGFGHVWLNP